MADVIKKLPINSGETELDVETFNVPGLYYSGGGIMNPPTGVSKAGHIIFTANHNLNYRKVIYMPYNTTKVYLKSYNMGTWSDWVLLGGGKSKLTPCALWRRCAA